MWIIKWNIWISKDSDNNKIILTIIKKYFDAKKPKLINVTSCFETKIISQIKWWKMVMKVPVFYIFQSNKIEIDVY